MKKILIGLTTSLIGIAPLATVIACGTSEDSSVTYTDSNVAQIKLNLDDGLIDASGTWKTIPTSTTDFIKTLASVIYEHGSKIKEADGVQILVSAPGYKILTQKIDSVSSVATLGEGIIATMLVNTFESLYLTKETVGGDSSGGASTGSGVEVDGERYSFSWTNKNPDVDVPTTIAELQAAVPNYYDTLEETDTGDALFQKLSDIQAIYRVNVGSYSDLWDHYEDSWIDVWDDNDGSIWDMYHEVPGTDSSEQNWPYQPVVNQDKGNGSGEGAAYNREHLIPQSFFRKSSEKNIKNDPHFVWPADKSVNSSRSNYHFEEVDASSTYTQGTSRGTGKISGETAIEPVNWFKGDIARAMFHFAVTWMGSPDYEGNAGTNFLAMKTGKYPTYPYFSNTDYSDLYREWSLRDPVDKYNADLNDSLSESHHTKGGVELTLRNPFVDMPDLAERIWG